MLYFMEVSYWDRSSPTHFKPFVFVASRAPRFASRLWLSLYQNTLGASVRVAPFSRKHLFRCLCCFKSLKSFRAKPKVKPLSCSHFGYQRLIACPLSFIKAMSEQSSGGAGTREARLRLSFANLYVGRLLPLLAGEISASLVSVVFIKTLKSKQSFKEGIKLL